jgi:ABC-2 type transport system permease protein
VTLLPGPWDRLSLLNPIVYMVNGLRYGMTGVTDVPVLPGLGIVVFTVVFGIGLVTWLLSTGKGLKP